MIFNYIKMLSVFVFICSSSSLFGATDLRLWYRQPAKVWEEALPLGNGRIGAMVFGGVQQERLQLNEATVCTGIPKPAQLNTSDRVFMAQKRALIFEGRYTEAEKLKEIKDDEGDITSGGNQKVVDRPPSVPNSMARTMQTLGDLKISFSNSNGAKNYRRELDLSTAIAKINYQIGDVTFTREMFISAPNQAIIIRLTASKPGQISFDLALSRPTNVSAETLRWLALPTEIAKANAMKPPSASCKIDGPGKMTMSGFVQTGGMFYVAQLQIVNDGGTLTANKDTIGVSSADSVSIILCAGTDYRQKNSSKICAEQLAVAIKTPYIELRQAHVADYQKLFSRVSLDLGATTQVSANLSTNERLLSYQKTNQGTNQKEIDSDPQLETLFFQFGRYLLISGSRENSPLPLALQGIWNDSLMPPWNGHFTIDINQQMYYWLAGPGNLEECRLPQIALLEYVAPSARRAARDGYNCGGLVIQGINIYGTGAYTGTWQDAGAWLAQDFWEHYAQTRDIDFLRNRAYPFLKDCAQFYLDFMVLHPTKNYLVTGPSRSPENTFIAPDGKKVNLSVGNTMTIAIIRDLFSNCLSAIEVLKIDEPFANQLRESLKKLPPYQIGKHGQLQEWLEDFEENDPGHRHLSHLFPIYPGHSIDRSSPELFTAAKKALDRRLEYGSGQTGWSRAWAMNIAARLGDGELAHDSYRMMLQKLSFPNLFSIHPRNDGAIKVFQIDGNLGASAGLLEMLLQSHSDEVSLLPAMPKNNWSVGSVRGIRARGGFIVDISWSGNALKKALIESTVGGSLKLRCKVPFILTDEGASIASRRDPLGGYSLTLETTANKKYEIVASLY